MKDLIKKICTPDIAAIIVLLAAVIMNFVIFLSRTIRGAHPWALVIGIILLVYLVLYVLTVFCRKK